MRVEERMHQMAVLCRLNHWTRDEFQKELEARYPHGPYHDGDGWDGWKSQVDDLYTAAMRDD